MAAKPAAPKSERELVWVHVAVIGERRVGKTNLVNRLVKDEYLSSKAPKPPLPPIKFEGPIKPEQSQEHAAEVIKLIIHDTDSTDEGLWETTDGKLHNMDVIVLAYDAKSREAEAESMTKCAATLDRLKEDEVLRKKPVLLVGTKIDCRKDDIKHAQTKSKAAELMPQYPAVEGCLYCSSRQGTNVAEVFWFARRLCIYPVSPLFDVTTKRLTEGCGFALRRVFRMCQTARVADDGRERGLSSEEIKAFQVHVFNQPLENAELEQVKKMVKDYAEKQTADRRDAFTAEDEMTLAGFHLMQEVFLTKARTELVWQVLWKYGYDYDLQLEPSAYNTSVETKPGDELQLSEHGRSLLKRWFFLHDEDADGYLSKKELENFFGPMGETHPFAELNDYTDSVVLCPVSREGSLSLAGFMGRWEFAVGTAPLQAMRWLAILGTDNPAAFVGRVKRRRRDKRALLRCLLLDKGVAGGDELMSNLSCDQIAASRRTGGKKQPVARRVGVVLVPAEDEVVSKSNANDDDLEADDKDERGPFLAVIRASDADAEASHLKNNSFYDVISVLVNDMDAQAARARVEEVAKSAGNLPVLACTVGKVQPRKAGDGGGALVSPSRWPCFHPVFWGLLYAVRRTRSTCRTSRKGTAQRRRRPSWYALRPARSRSPELG